jgi:ABC-type uncharacterized transport system substrate-binding protein
VLVALGTQVIDLLQAANLQLPILAGAAPILPSERGISGLSTLVDPAIQLRMLLRLAPATRRIRVVHHPREAWLISAASRAAESRGLTLIAQSVLTARDAAIGALNAIRSMSTATDAFWLTSDPQFWTTDVVQGIIEQAWNSAALVYSSVLEHVAQGALFGTYPDARRIAQRLARMLATALTPPALDADPNFAVNVRTATHLVTRLDMSELARFTLRLGER